MRTTYHVAPILYAVKKRLGTPPDLVSLFCAVICSRTGATGWIMIAREKQKLVSYGSDAVFTALGRASADLKDLPQVTPPPPRILSVLHPRWLISHNNYTSLLIQLFLLSTIVQHLTLVWEHKMYVHLLLGSRPNLTHCHFSISRKGKQLTFSMDTPRVSMLISHFNAAPTIGSSFALTLLIVSHFTQTLPLHAIDFLLEVTHSCEPNVAFDMSSRDRSQWHVRAVQAIEQGTPRKFINHPLVHVIFSQMSR